MRFVAFCVLVLIAHALWASETVDWLTFSGFTGFVSRQDSQQEKWRDIAAFWQKSEPAFDKCLSNSLNCNNIEMSSLARLFKGFESQSAKDKLRTVNRYVNQELGNAFASPWRVQLKYNGEDDPSSATAVIKYLILQKAGFKDQDMRLVSVKSRLNQEQETFLVVHSDQTYFLSHKFNVVLPQYKLIDIFIPEYALNNKDMWVFAPNIIDEEGPTNE